MYAQNFKEKSHNSVDSKFLTTATISVVVEYLRT